jgi:hypothetical protein
LGGSTNLAVYVTRAGSWRAVNHGKSGRAESSRSAKTRSPDTPENETQAVGRSSPFMLLKGYRRRRVRVPIRSIRQPSHAAGGGVNFPSTRPLQGENSRPKCTTSRERRAKRALGWPRTCELVESGKEGFLMVEISVLYGVVIFFCILVFGVT